MSTTQRGELVAFRRWLAGFRETVERKTADLDAEQLARPSVPPSSLTLLGLVRHLAQMEHHWFSRALRQSGEDQLFVVDGDWDSQFDVAGADADVVRAAFEVWRRTCAETDNWLDEHADVDLGHVLDPGDPIETIRDVLLQVSKKYARHCGHLDLLRECIDGRTGE